MKKIITLSLLIVLYFNSQAQQTQAKERAYIFYVPEKYMNAFNAVIYGQSDGMSVGNYRLIINLYESQLQRQQQQFHVQDSIAQIKGKPKADSVETHRGEPVPTGIKPQKRPMVNIKKP